METKKEAKERREIFKRIIENIVVLLEKIDFNEINENLKIEYVNSLIILLESFGEYNNNYLHEIMFADNGENKDLKSSFFLRFISVYIDLRECEYKKLILIIIN